jgi:hypothetical protein
MLKILSLFIIIYSFNSYAQDLPSFTEIEKTYKNVIQSDKAGSYRFLNKKKDGEFLLFCYQDGKKIDRYFNLKLKSFESKFLYYDVVTIDNRVIRVPNTCFIEVKK